MQSTTAVKPTVMTDADMFPSDEGEEEEGEEEEEEEEDMKMMRLAQENVARLRNERILAKVAYEAAKRELQSSQQQQQQREYTGRSLHPGIVYPRFVRGQPMPTRSQFEEGPQGDTDFVEAQIEWRTLARLDAMQAREQQQQQQQQQQLKKRQRVVSFNI